MSGSQNSGTNWKTPNELIKLHRLKQKKKALQARLEKKDLPENEKKTLLAATSSTKRKNPFAKESKEICKKSKTDLQIDETTEDTIFSLINETERQQEKIQMPKPQPQVVLKSFDPQSFANKVIMETDEDDLIEEPKPSQHLPIDWSLKTRMRLLCKTQLPATSLKTSQEASGLTSFVRCIDPQNSSSGLDISPGARFHQSTLYWQHPHIPWLTLFPRNSKANIGKQIGENERASLAKDWVESFRGLFQLVRARQCTYFYLCANTFTALFRAAGVGGRVETHALLTPTSRGLRSALRQEDIEFIYPLKKDSGLNKSHDNSLTNSSDEPTQDNKLEINENDDNEDDDDLEEEKWLESLGVDAKEIKKINSVHTRQVMNKEMTDDFSDQSIILIEGVDCQAFFNFLLNSKSTVANVGRLAGIPPTLLAPVAFPGATMRSLQTRSSKVRMDAVDYFSIEMKGVILPHILPYISSLLLESKDSFSATMVANSNTLAFTKASQKLIEDAEKENANSNQVFGKENLSDCGLLFSIVDDMCRVTPDAVRLMERMCYSTELGGYTWS